MTTMVELRHLSALRPRIEKRTTWLLLWETHSITFISRVQPITADSLLQLGAIIGVIRRLTGSTRGLTPSTPNLDQKLLHATKAIA